MLNHLYLWCSSNMPLALYYEVHRSVRKTGQMSHWQCCIHFCNEYAHKREVLVFRIVGLNCGIDSLIWIFRYENFAQFFFFFLMIFLDRQKYMSSTERKIYTFLFCVYVSFHLSVVASIAGLFHDDVVDDDTLKVKTICIHWSILN